MRLRESMRTNEGLEYLSCLGGLFLEFSRHVEAVLNVLGVNAEKIPMRVGTLGDCEGEIARGDVGWLEGLGTRNRRCRNCGLYTFWPFADFADFIDFSEGG